MNEEQSKQIAAFRYGIIGDFVNQTSFEYGRQEELFRYKCGCKWKIPYSERTKVSRSSIIRWIRLYRGSGEKIEALYPKERNDIYRSRVIDKLTENNLKWLIKHSDSHSVESLIQEMKCRELVTSGQILAISTVYRFLNNNKLMCYLKERKIGYKRATENHAENKIWMLKLLQGKRQTNPSFQGW